MGHFAVIYLGDPPSALAIEHFGLFVALRKAN